MIFQFIARLGLDVVDFVAGAKKATAATNKMKSDMTSRSVEISSSFKGIGSAIASAFSVAAVTGYMRELTATVGEIKDMSELLGISVEETQKLQSAASLAGQSFSTIVKAFQSVEQARAKAMAGEKGSSLMFQILGIDPSKGNASDIISAALAASTKGVQQNAAAFDLLGTNVQRVKLTFDELAKNTPIRLFAEEDIEAIDKSVKALDEARKGIMAAALPFASDIIRTLTAGVNLLNPSKVSEIYGAYRPDQESLPDYKKRTPFEQFHIGLLRGIQNPGMLRDAITDVASRAMGFDMTEQSRFEAMPVPEAKLRKGPDSYDPYFQFLKTTADSAKRTADILEKTTNQ